jgi:hypothetical protein
MKGFIKKLLREGLGQPDEIDVMKRLIDFYKNKSELSVYEKASLDAWEEKLRRVISSKEQAEFYARSSNNNSNKNIETKPLERTDLVNLFTTALEGGSNYWYYIKHLPKDVKYDMQHIGVHGSKAISKYLLGGGKMYFYDKDEIIGDDSDDGYEYMNEKGYLGYVDIDKILDGINLLKNKYSEIHYRILNGQFDADDADVFLQLCVMGEVKFG